MSTGNISLDILLTQIQEDAISANEDAVFAIRRRYPTLSEKEAREIHALVCGAMATEKEADELVVTAPPSFAIKTKTTKIAVQEMLRGAQSSILLTGYSLSDYFSDLVDCIISKSQTGVFVKFFVNDIAKQTGFDKLLRYRGKFLKIYNYQNTEDKMAALHAKVICVDKRRTLITSANLSYHGQQGNIELGALIESQKTAKQIDDLFTKLLFNKVFVEI